MNHFKMFLIFVLLARRSSNTCLRRHIRVPTTELPSCSKNPLYHFSFFRALAAMQKMGLPQSIFVIVAFPYTTCYSVVSLFFPLHFSRARRLNAKHVRKIRIKLVYNDRAQEKTVLRMCWASTSLPAFTMASAVTFAS